MRQCGKCEICCEIAEVRENDFLKLAYEKCKYQCNGCSIFGKSERPRVCSDFKCVWLNDFGNEEDRPDKNGLMISISRFNCGDWIFTIETKPNAVLTTGKTIIIDLLNNIDLPVIVSDYGVKPPNDKGNMTSAEIKIYPTATDATNLTNEIHTHHVTATYDANNNLTSYKVIE